MLPMRCRFGAVGALGRFGADGAFGRFGTVAALAVFLFAASPISAQQPTPPPAERQGDGQEPVLLPPGMMMGPGGMMRRRNMMRMCDPRGFGLAGWRVERLERTLELNDEQRSKLDDVIAASAKAIEQLLANCPRELPLTPTGRLEMTEARLSAMLESVRMLRAAFEPFYAALTDEQKARMTADAEGRGWRFEERERRRRRR